MYSQRLSQDRFGRYEFEPFSVVSGGFRNQRTTESMHRRSVEYKARHKIDNEPIYFRSFRVCYLFWNFEIEEKRRETWNG